MRATYYISFGSTWTQIYPSNEPVLKLEQEAGEIFKRWKVDRFKITRTKNSSVYCTLMNMFFDILSFGTEINYRVDIKGIPKYYFKDTIRAGNINIQNEYYESTPDPDDKYEPILRLYNKKYDNTDGSLLLYDLDILYPVDTSNSFSNVDFDSFYDTTQSVSYTHSGTPIGSEYARSYINTPGLNNTVVVIVRNFTHTGDDPKLRLVNDSFAVASNEVYITANGKYELTATATDARYLELSVLNLTESPITGSFDYNLYLPVSTSTGGGAKLYNLIDRFLNHASYFNLSPVCTVVSTLLFGSALGSDAPVPIVTYMAAYPLTDYVIRGTSIFNNLYVTRADAFTITKEDNVEICLKDVMDILKSKRLWWFIDEDGKFRIEHEKYFRSYAMQADLRANSFAIYQPEVDRHIYSYEGENYNQINFTENNLTHEDWTPIRIEYDPLLTGSEVQDVRTSVTTDIQTLIDAPESSGSGLTLIRCDAYDNICLDESLIIPGNYYLNQKLSLAWMSQYYMDYFAESQVGTLKTGSHTFVHVKEMVKQSGVKFFWNTDLDWKKPFTLFVGTGWVSSVEYFPETGFYSLDVLYNPYAFDISGAAGTTGSTTADSTTTTVDSTLITVDG